MIGDIEIEPYYPRMETQILIAECIKIAEIEHPITARELFYQLSMKKMIQHNEKECDRLTMILTRARRAGFIPWEWIEDRSRNPLIVPMYSSPNEFLEQTVRNYCRDTWLTQPYFIMIMLEKEALANIVWSVAAKYSVPVFPTKGYSGNPLFLEIRNMLLKYQQKSIAVLTLGDFDPSGEDIHRSYVENLDFFGIRPERIARIALTPDQAQQYNLPSLPLKRDENGELKDPRAKKFLEKHGDAYTELDALKPSSLREIVEKSILKYLDLAAFLEDYTKEKEEKEALGRFAKKADPGFD